MKPKYQHIGDGSPVVDSSGWRLGPGDPPVSLPNGADATVIAAVRNGTLIKVEAIEEDEVKRDDRNLLKI